MDNAIKELKLLSGIKFFLFLNNERKLINLEMMSLALISKKTLAVFTRPFADLRAFTFFLVSFKFVELFKISEL